MFLSLLNLIVAQADPINQATSQPASQPDESLGEQMYELLGPAYEHTTWTGWIVLLGGIFGGLLVGRIAQSVLLNVDQRCKKRGWIVRGAMFRFIAGPAKLSIFALGLLIGWHGLKFSNVENAPPLPIQGFFLKFIAFIYIIAIGWFLYNLVELVDYALRRITAKSETKIDDTVVLLLRKALRIFLLIIMVLFVAQNVFEANVTSFLAGLGIAGLAVSLAAQDSIKNLFGSITVLISRPFGLGDRILFGAYDGTVENISFRDTKIRTAAGHLITVPNMKFTDSVIENISARPWVARTINIGLTCDTSTQRVNEALEIIRKVVHQPGIIEFINMPDRPPRVYFTEFGPSSLNLQIAYAYAIKEAGRDWWTYMDHAEKLNLKVLEALSNAGIKPAYPSQTVYLAGRPSELK